MQSEEEKLRVASKIFHHQQQIEELKIEESRLNGYLAEFKQALSRKHTEQIDQKSKLVETEKEKHERQLERELGNAKLILKNYEHEVKIIRKKNKQSITNVDDAETLNKTITQRETVLKTLNQELKDLQTEKRKWERMLQRKNQKQDGCKIAKMYEELQKHKDILEKITVQQQEKVEQVQKRKESLFDVENNYLEICKDVGETPVNYEEFKASKKKEVKDPKDNPRTGRNSSSKKYCTVKEMISTLTLNETLEPTETNLLNMRNKKEIAETALSNASKKHTKDIEILKETIEQLKKENELLASKLLEKKKQKEISEHPQNKVPIRNVSQRKLLPIK